MPRAPKVCSVAGCPELTQGRLCEEHERQFQRRRNADRTQYAGSWKRLSKEARRRQRFCSCTDADHGHGIPCGATEDLTADHVVAAAQGGASSRSNIAVLCRSCNTKKGAK